MVEGGGEEGMWEWGGGSGNTDETKLYVLWFGNSLWRRRIH